MAFTKLQRAALIAASIACLAPQHAHGDSASAIKKKIKQAIRDKDGASATEALEAAAALEGDDGAELILDFAIPLGLNGLVKETVTALSKVKDRGPVIKAAAKHRVPDVRYLALRALTPFDGEAERKACIDALKDKSELVAVQAVRSTQAHATKEIISAWIELLIDEEKAKGSKYRPTLIRELIGALANMTEQDIEAGQDWKNYWEAHSGEWRAPENKTGEGDDANVMDRMKRHRKADIRTLERLGSADVIVMTGSSDKVEQVLSSIKIEHKRIRREEFSSLKLTPNSVLILNCNGKNKPFSDEELIKISRFVAEGGYLFSSDWQLKFTIEKAFPGSIAFLGEGDRYKKGEEPKVPILPVNSNHPYLRDVFPLSTIERSGYRWMLDGRSHLIKIKNRRGVIPLVRAPDLDKKNAPFVAVTFRWNGRVVTKARPITGPKDAKANGGSVLHVLGHFKNQRDKSDKFALQQLLLNFILEKQRERRVAGS